MNRSARFQVIPIGSFRRAGANIAMDITVRDHSQALETGQVADEIPRRPLWPALIIAFAISATMLWTGLVLWLLSRILLVVL